MTFIIITVFSMVVLSMLFNMGRLAFQSIIKVFNALITWTLVVFLAAMLHSPDGTILALANVFKTIKEIVRVLAA